MSNAEKDGKPNRIEYFESERRGILGLISEKKYVAAIKRIKLLGKEFGDYAPYYILWAEYFKAKNELSRALYWFKRAIEVDKTSKDAYIGMALIYDAQKYDNLCEEILWKGVHNSGDPLYFYSNLENYHIAKNNTGKAVEIVKIIETEYAGRPEVFYKRGEAAYGLDLVSDTIDLLRQSTDQNYAGLYHYYYLANCFGRIGLNAEAIDFWKKAIAFRPGDYRLYDELYRFLLFSEKTPDQVIMTGLAIKKTELSNDPNGTVNLAHLNEDYAPYREHLANFLAIDINDLTIDYLHFCEVFKVIAYNVWGYKNLRFDPVNSLIKCIAKLKELKFTSAATLYEGWHALIINDINKAGALFTILTQGPEIIPAIIRDRALRGLADANRQADKVQGSQDSSDTATYGLNLTDMARRGKIPKTCGLEEIVNKLAHQLLNGTKKSMALTGLSGVGKTEAIRQLAHYFNSFDCPEQLKNFRIIQTSTSEVLSGSRYIGMWEKRLEDLCNAYSWDKKAIIYFEDISHIFGAGITEGSPKNFADYLIPRIEQNQVVIIGEMDSRQAQKAFWENPRFENVITEIKMAPPDESKLPLILKGETDRLKLQFSVDAIQEIIDLTRIFMPYRAFPGKAVDIVRRIADQKSMQSPTVGAVSKTDVITAFCLLTGEPDFMVDQGKVLETEKIRRYFDERVLGQEEAVNSVIEAVMTFKARLNDENRPIRSFLFVGPTGVGKTELAKVSAEYLFGSREKIIRLNMSEYNDYTAVAKMIGYAGGGPSKQSHFLGQVRRTPFSVVLLDEIEKAHPDILNLLLQLLDEGIIYDADGKPAHFQSTIIIMTSNLGSRHYTAKSIGFETDPKDLQQAVLSDVKSFFSPEIYNRFDEIVCFKMLSRDVLEIIINREIGKVLERKGIISLGVEVEIDPLVRHHIIETGYDAKYGARHIKRAVEKAVAAPLAALIATSELRDGQQIRVNLRKSKAVADLIDLQEKIQSLPSATAISHKTEIIIPDKEIAQALIAIGGRINSLKSKLHYDDIINEKNGLQDIMTQATFWDNPAKASEVLRRFSELNKKTERIHRWEHLYDKLKADLAGIGRRTSRDDRPEARSQFMGLMKDIESAEMEILLEGKYDFADAFIILNSSDGGSDGLKWMLELAGVYINWARRRGYRYRVFGENPGIEHGSHSIFIHIAGMNAFGLLKNERGLHRKVVAQKTGKKWNKRHFDCETLILADVQPVGGRHDEIEIDIKKVTPVRKGWRIKSISKKVSLTQKSSKLSINFYTDEIVESDKNLPGDMFQSYIHFRCQEPKADGSNDVWGSIIRTYESGATTRIIDHRTKMTLNNIKDYLGGKIDSLLLERLI